jgi:hypothetical protein
MLDFDKAFKMKDDKRLDEMWAIISAAGLWANVEDVSKVIGKYVLYMSREFSIDVRPQKTKIPRRHVNLSAS